MRIDLVLGQKFLELIGVEIGYDFITRHERGHIRLRGKLLHLLIRLPIFSNVNFLETISLLLEIILRVDAPRTPLAAVQRQFHQQRRNKQTMIAASTGILSISRESRNALHRTLIRFRPNNAPPTGFASENALPRLRRIIEWNDANGDFEVVLDLFFHIP